MYNTFGFANIANAPLSGPSVADMALQANGSTGNGQWVWNFPLKKEGYMGTYWSTNAEFEGTQNGTNKMIFISQPGEDNSFIGWMGAVQRWLLVQVGIRLKCI